MEPEVSDAQHSGYASSYDALTKPSHFSSYLLTSHRSGIFHGATPNQARASVGLTGAGSGDVCIIEHMTASMQNLLDQFITSPQVTAYRPPHAFHHRQSPHRTSTPVASNCPFHEIQAVGQQPAASSHPFHSLSALSFQCSSWRVSWQECVSACLRILREKV